MRLGAFAGLSALAAWRYAAIEARPPAARVAAVVASAVIAAAALSLLRTGGSRRTTSAGSRLIVLGAAFLVALLAAGVPVGMLAPAGWEKLAHRAHGGVRSISTTLWPYNGPDAWTRIDILLGLVVAPIGAAALGFWPAAEHRQSAALRYRVRQALALTLLLTVYVIGVVDSSTASMAGDGLLLLVLVVAWLWLPDLGAGRGRGRITPKSGAGSPQPRRARPIGALAWLGAAGGLAALLAGQIAGHQAWLDYRAWDVFGSSSQGVAFSWDQSYGPITWSRSERTMFTVSARSAQLWKTTTLDRFDGLRFVRSGEDASSGYQDLPLPLNPHWYRFAAFTITGLRSNLLPGEQGTTIGVNYHGTVLHDPDGTARTSGRVLAGGARYTALSYVPAPTPAELRAAPHPFPAAYLRYTDFDLPTPAESGLRLAATDPQPRGVFSTARTVGAPRPGVPPGAVPKVARRILASPYAGMYRLARRLAAGRRSSYAIATAIEGYLKSNYLYSEHPPARRYPLESFLFTDGAGYCQQFSGAMTLMLRMLGIPSRVAAGFLPGSYDRATHQFIVRAVDAHSWVEVYFDGIGWVPFDPTPPRTVGVVPRFRAYESERTVFPYAALAATMGRFPGRSGRGAAPIQPRPSSSDAPLPPAALIALELALGLALLTLGLLCLRGRMLLRRSLDDDGELATHELVRALRRLGYVLPATVTLARVESIVRLHGGVEAARYIRLLRERRYAPGPVASATLRDRRRLRLALTAHLGLASWLHGLWALPPGTLSWRVSQPGVPWLRSQCRASANRAPGSRAPNWTSPIAIAGQPRKLNARV